jgi:gamma-glutamyltranspeptidase/glutathione hydrolase
VGSAGRFSKDTASKVYDMMTGINGTAYIKNQFIEYFFKFMTKDFIDLDPHHSDALVVGDSEGNLISIVHSINTKPFGTGLFVDGIALPDSAAIQRLVIKSAGPGNRVPDPVEPNIIMTNGRPLVASASIGGAERQVMFQNLLSILVWGRDVKQANDAPHFLGESGSIMAGGYMYSQKVASGLFDPNIINQVQNMGQPIKVVPGGSQPTSQGDPGYWVGVKRSNDNNKDPQYSASAPFTLNGLAEATL